MINTFYLWRLILAHLLADYVFQNNKIAKWKSESVYGVLVHSIIFFIFSVLFTALEKFPPLNFDFNILSNIWYILLLLGITHFLVDQGRVTAIKKYGWPDNFEFFILDQCLHFALIVFFIVILKLSPIYKSLPGKAELWTMLFSIYVLATYFVTIIIFYLEKKEKKIAVINGPEKYFGIVERLFICIAFTLPGKIFYFIPVIFFGRLYMYFKDRNKLVFDYLTIFVANIITIILGLIIHFVILQ